MHARHWILVVLAAALFVPACKSEKGEICGHLESLLDSSGGEYNRTACEEQVRLTQESCTNFDAISACWIAADSIGSFGACRAQCVREGE
jgi:hypothetical protein